MADQLSIEMLAFNFNSRTFAFQRLAQGLSRSVSAFSSFVREYLDPCIAADKCFSYVDDIGAASHTTEEMLENLVHIFQCIRASGLKLSPSKCEFAVPQMKFLGNTITSEGMSPNNEKVEKFLKNVRMPQNPKQVKRMIGFFQFFRPYLPKLGEKLLPFYKLLRQDTDFKITSDHHAGLKHLKTDLQNACDTSLKLPKPGAQYVILADASYYAAGYVLMMEEKPESADGKSTYAPVSFGSKVFGPAQLKLSIYAKEFLAVHFAFDQFTHILWGSTLPTIVLTDNKSLTRFFQSKTIPALLWRAVDQLMSFSFVLGHIPGVANVAADYLSRMHINPADKIQLKISERIPVIAVEVDITPKVPDNSLTSILSSFDIHEINPTVVQTQPLDFVITHLTAFYRPEISSLSEPNPLDHYDFIGTSEPLDLIAEQQKDRNLVIVKSWLTTPNNPDDTYLNTELKKYAKHLPRLTLSHNGVLYRQFYDHAGKPMQLQLCVPQHLRRALLYRIHNSKFKGHLGIVKTAAEFRKHFYFPQFTEFLLDYIRNCSTCQQIKVPRRTLIAPPLESISAEQMFPGDTMMIDLVGKMKPSAGFKYILTGIDVFTKYLFSVALPRADAETVARALVSILMRHSYLPETIVTDKGTTFVSKLMHELTNLLEIKLKHASLKHPQTLGLLERTHGPLKRYLSLHENSTESDWHRHLDIATFIHNTSYNTTTGCTPSTLFHGREPTNPLSLRFRTQSRPLKSTSLDYTNHLKDTLVTKFADHRENLILAYQKYRSVYDRKAKAEPLYYKDYCLLLDPRLYERPQKLISLPTASKYHPLYRVEQVLTHSNYIVRKVGTNYTQCVHRVRLKPIKPQYEFTDLPEIDPNNFTTDPNLSENQLEPNLTDAALPDLIGSNVPTQSDLLISNPTPITTTATMTTPAITGTVTTTSVPTRAAHLRPVHPPRTIPRLLAGNNSSRDQKYQALRKKIRQAITRRKSWNLPQHSEQNPGVQPKRRLVPDTPLEPILERPGSADSQSAAESQSISRSSSTISVHNLFDTTIPRSQSEPNLPTQPENTQTTSSTEKQSQNLPTASPVKIHQTQLKQPSPRVTRSKTATGQSKLTVTTLPSRRKHNSRPDSPSRSRIPTPTLSSSRSSIASRSPSPTLSRSINRGKVKVNIRKK